MTSTQIAKAFADISIALMQWRLWHMLAWNEIKSRYRRSTIGPFWVTLNITIQTITMGFLASFLFNYPIGKFLPYVCAGNILWTLIGAIIVEGAGTFIGAAGSILQVSRPLSLYIIQNIWRNVIIFVHNIAIYIIVALIYDVKFNANILFLFASLPILLLAVSWPALLAGMFSARFRDIPLMTQSILGIVFWFTPILYYPEQLGGKQFLIELNPLTHLLYIVRDPMLGQSPPAISWAVAIGFAAIGWLFTFFVFARFRARIPYWL